MDRDLEQLVWRRARARCEYCRMPQEYDGTAHEIDHVIAVKHGGPTTAINLALACFPCNNYKGPNVAGVDPVTNRVSQLFHPRRNKWRRHFVWNGPFLLGRTATGRATIAVLCVNHPGRVLLRQALMDEGVYPNSIE